MFPRECPVCLLDYGKVERFGKPQELSEHVEQKHAREIGAFLVRHAAELS